MTIGLIHLGIRSEAAFHITQNYVEDGNNLSSVCRRSITQTELILPDVHGKKHTNYGAFNCSCKSLPNHFKYIFYNMFALSVFTIYISLLFFYFYFLWRQYATFCDWNFIIVAAFYVLFFMAFQPMWGAFMLYTSHDVFISLAYYSYHLIES